MSGSQFVENAQYFVPTSFVEVHHKHAPALNGRRCRATFRGSSWRREGAAIAVAARLQEREYSGSSGRISSVWTWDTLGGADGKPIRAGTDLDDEILSGRQVVGENCQCDLVLHVTNNCEASVAAL